MTEPSTSAPTVLFVDDDAPFLEMVRESFVELGKDPWQIVLAPDTAQALRLLGEHAVDLAVLDVAMPEVDGLQLISILNRDYPNLPKAFLTGNTDTATRLAGLEAGAELFLEKPADLKGMETVFATLNELIKWHRKQEARGSARRANLVEIVKLECASRNSRLVEVIVPDGRGLIYIKEGDIIHAESEGRRGQSAFTFLAAHPEAEFVLKQYAEPLERSVYRQWEFLVLEAFQLREQLAAAAEAKPKEGPAPTEVAPTPTPAKEVTPPQSPVKAVMEAAAARATSAPARAKAPPKPTPRAPTPTPVEPPRPAAPVSAPSQPALAFEPVSRLRLVGETVPAAAPRPGPPGEIPLRMAPATVILGTDSRTSPLVVEEMLVCTGQNEVLYEWRCHQSETLLRRINELRDKARTLAGRTSLGATDRIEYSAPEGRLVVHLEETTAILVRTNTPARPLPSPVSPFNMSSTDWLSRQGQVTGLIACGLVRPRLAPMSCSFVAEFPSDTLNGLWRASTEALALFQQRQFQPWLIRWIFDRGQSYFMKRLDGLALGVLVVKEPGAVDTAAVQQLFAEFNVLILA